MARKEQITKKLNVLCEEYKELSESHCLRARLLELIDYIEKTGTGYGPRENYKEILRIYK